MRQKQNGLAPIPVFHGKTAYGLVSAVRRAVLAEPKRVNMTKVATAKLPEYGGPACGTVGCFAGWVCLLTDGRDATLSRMPNTAMDRALSILGDHIDYSLDGIGNNHVFNAGDGDACETTVPGTRAHARAVAARITKFQKRNASLLRAKKLSPEKRRSR